MFTYDLIDKHYSATGVMLTDAEGNKYPEMVAQDGYFVNVLPQEDMSLVQPYMIVVATPSRTFAGRNDTVCLKFANRAEWLSLGIEPIEEEIQ